MAFAMAFCLCGFNTARSATSFAAAPAQFPSTFLEVLVLPLFFQHLQASVVCPQVYSVRQNDKSSHGKSLSGTSCRWNQELPVRAATVDFCPEYIVSRIVRTRLQPSR